jgi:prepilin-type N-terminal cleavage/methylation domain-containing protein
MKKPQQPQTHKKGFTLIELSIVLVIIGLIVGGVLVGQDLIKAAEIRATVGQLEKYAAAVNTFRGKYNGLPGDVLNASTFGLISSGQSSSTGFGNGNALIESSGSLASGGSGETAMFWRHMAQANLISESVTALNTYSPIAITIDDTYLPLAKMGKGNRIAVTSTAGLNYFMMSGAATVVVTTGAYTGTDVLTPIEAYQIDGKLDDGLPTTGLVVSSGASAVGSATTTVNPSAIDGGQSTPAAGDCYDSDSPQAYAMATLSTTPGCTLRIRSSF